MEIYIKIFAKCLLSAIVMYLERVFTPYKYLTVVYVCISTLMNTESSDALAFE